MINILVVDDEPHITELIQFNLELNDYNVEVANNGKEAIEKARKDLFDLIILDVMLPFVDGFGVLKILKKDERYIDVPIIMLTAKNSEADKVLGLETGADDYLTKPFSIKELMARINVLLRRVRKSQSQSKSKDLINIKNLSIDNTSHTVSVNGNEIELTLKEFDILLILCQNEGNVVKRDELLDKVWGYEYFGDSRAIDVHIRHIRKKINDYDNEHDYIETIRGIGYKIR